jgi:hypothetical protein
MTGAEQPMHTTERSKTAAGALRSRPNNNETDPGDLGRCSEICIEIEDLGGVPMH